MITLRQHAVFQKWREQFAIDISRSTYSIYTRNTSSQYPKPKPFNDYFQALRESYPSSLPHIDHAPDAASILHIRKRLVDTLQRLPMRDELVDLELAGHVIVDQVGQLRAAFDAAERAAFPHAAGDELEGWWESASLPCL